MWRIRSNGVCVNDAAPRELPRWKWWRAAARRSPNTHGPQRTFTYGSNVGLGQVRLASNRVSLNPGHCRCELPHFDTVADAPHTPNTSLPRTAKIAQVGQDLQNSRVGEPYQYIGLVIHLFLRGVHKLVEKLQRNIIELKYFSADKLDLESLRSLFVPNLRYSR
jgi:hypothetical protein